MDIKVVLAVVCIVIATMAAFSKGWIQGYEAGLKEGQADSLMHAAGKCFRHIAKEIK